MEGFSGQDGARNIDYREVTTGTIYDRDAWTRDLFQYENLGQSARANAFSAPYQYSVGTLHSPESRLSQQKRSRA